MHENLNPFHITTDIPFINLSSQLSSYLRYYALPVSILRIPFINKDPDQPRIDMFKHELSVIIIQTGILS